MSDPAIRDANETDLPAIVALMVQLGYPNQSAAVTDAHRAALATLRATPGQRLLVIEDGDGRVAGTAQLMVLPNLTLGGLPRAVVENVCIDERVRGRRYGERLAEYCVAQARAAGCFKLALSTHRNRQAAHRFWERCGFEHTHRGYALALVDLSSTPDTGAGPAGE